MPDDEYLTVQEAAALFRSKPGALYTQRHRGQAPGALAVQVGGKLLYRRSDLVSWFESQTTAVEQARP